jgi:hypothetical protein
MDRELVGFLFDFDILSVDELDHYEVDEDAEGESPHAFAPPPSNAKAPRQLARIKIPKPRK